MSQHQSPWEGTFSQRSHFIRVGQQRRVQKRSKLLLLLFRLKLVAAGKASAQLWALKKPIQLLHNLRIQG
jgi:hypothetical protein